MFEIETAPLITSHYWAGLFDGEGCVMIQRIRNGRYADSYTLTVNLSNTDYDILIRLRDAFGGAVAIKRTTSNKAWWSPAWTWRLHSRPAARFLQAIQPHAIIKRAQIDIALEFEAGINPDNSRPVSAEELSRRVDCYQRLKVFKTHRPRWSGAA